MLLKNYNVYSKEEEKNDTNMVDRSYNLSISLLRVQSMIHTFAKELYSSHCFELHYSSSSGLLDNAKIQKRIEESSLPSSDVT